MTSFKQISDKFFAAPQISPQDIEAAKAQGVALVICNRPDGEAPGQPCAADLEREARAAGLEFAHIPFGPAGLCADDLDAFDAARRKTPGPVLGYCAGGMRSALLWAFASVRDGSVSADEALAACRNAGFDLDRFRSSLELFENQD